MSYPGISKVFMMILFSVAVFACSNPSDKKAKTDTRPNIVFIIGDDVGCYDQG